MIVRPSARIVRVPLDEGDRLGARARPTFLLRIQLHDGICLVYRNVAEWAAVSGTVANVPRGFVIGKIRTIQDQRARLFVIVRWDMEHEFGGRNGKANLEHGGAWFDGIAKRLLQARRVRSCRWWDHRAMLEWVAKSVAIRGIPWKPSMRALCRRSLGYPRDAGERQV